jgi:hypothetical protein
MNAIYRAILEFCLDDFRSVRPLRDRIPQSTVYRGVMRLMKVGWLQKEGTFYKTTEAGRRQLTEGQERLWDGVALHYPPLRLIPTAVHRCLAELILAAIVMRQHGTRPDRHPFFVCAGGTLKWKSSLALFLCAALHLEPALFLVDCGCESGKSLAIRRSGSGTLVFKRELLDGVFIALDEFLTADAGVRATLRLFLSGQLVMPFENESVRIQPVPLLILNPRDKPTLEGRLGLSAPQIRRAIVANLDMVPMPDLAVTGEEALTAARAHAPLILSAPAIDCRLYHRQIVALTRAILLPETEERLDVHIVETLCSGMTSFIPDPNEAIAHVGHALGTIAETMNWTRTGWIDAVLHFSTDPKKRVSQPAKEPSPPVATVAGRMPPLIAGPERTPSSVLSLQVPHTIRESGLPSLALSDALKGKLVWLAEETGRSVEEVLPLLITFFRRWQEDPHTLMQMSTILSLAHELDVAHIEVTTLLEYLETQAMLAQSHRTFEDIPHALRLIDALSALPTPWDWPAARAALRNIALFLRAGITPEQIKVVLAQYCELEELGFDGSTAVAVGKALTRAGAVGPNRAAALKHMASLAVKNVQVQSLEAAQVTLTVEVTRLDTQQGQLKRSISEMTKRVDDLHRQQAEAQQRLTQLEGEWTDKSEDLKVLRALRTFLLRKDAAIDAFFADLDRVRQYRKQGRAPNHYAVLYLEEVRQQFLGFMQQIAEEGQQSRS